MRKSFIWIKKCLEINKIILGVNRSNQQAIKAYKKFGFLETDNSDEKSIKMEYLIGPTK
jgi:ribosomal protein S18 acetylase RimI-like enzyme